jgi:transcriptional regulator with XRE-family HTH domain
VDGAWWAEIVRQVRRRLDLSQRQLAVRAGVPKSTVADLEAGHVVPNLRTLGLVLEVAGMRLEVVDLTDEPVSFHSDTHEPRDRAQRRFPPHLDARLRHPGVDPARPGILRPGTPWTFHLKRERRDAVRLAGLFGVWGSGPPAPGGFDGAYVRDVWGETRAAAVLAAAGADIRAARDGPRGYPFPFLIHTAVLDVGENAVRDVSRTAVWDAR